jgi:hypothetical protein
MCGAPVQDLSLEGVDVGQEAVVQGTVTKAGQPVGGAFVRLLDGTGEFTAEVVTSESGAFRFFAAPGEWTVRALAPGATGETKAVAATGEVATAEIALA